MTAVEAVASALVSLGTTEWLLRGAAKLSWTIL